MKENEVISLYFLLNKHESISLKNNEEKADLVRDFLAHSLNGSHSITIDMEKMKSISPSFAYIAFGKLFDIYGAEVRNKLSFINDKLNLSFKIEKAINRREEVLSI